jgi:predicted  nucleic acid-binding Zn-ribbon protein
MGEQATETQLEVTRNSQSLDQAIGRLWEKIKAASELVSRLKGENRELVARASALESEVFSLRSEITNRELELKKLRAERTSILQSNGDTRFSDEEKEMLKGRIRELIAKINSYL